MNEAWYVNIHVHTHVLLHTCTHASFSTYSERPKNDMNIVACFPDWNSKDYAMQQTSQYLRAASAATLSMLTLFVQHVARVRLSTCNFGAVHAQ
jgi:hypothetical protein